MTYYPVLMNIESKRCVVCGGGEVALRKTRALLDCGASVEVISPSCCAGLVEMAGAGKLRIHSREYREKDLEGAFVAIAATDSKETNATIAGEAHRCGCFVNAVDDAASSDFIVPACLKRGDLTIAVSTSGRSPALARKLRAGLEDQFGREYAELVRLVSEVRSEIRQRGISVDEDTWQAGLDPGLLAGLLREGKAAEARRTIVRNLIGEVD
jgi:siroheme synthase-like protein